MFDFEEDLQTQINTYKVLGQNLVDAARFYKKVKASTTAEKIAVGSDHWEWLFTAAMDLAEELEKLNDA